MLNVEHLEELQERVWRGKMLQHAVAHILVGLGFGLLIYPSVRGAARALAVMAIAASLAMHVSAALTASPRESLAERLQFWR